MLIAERKDEVRKEGVRRLKEARRKQQSYKRDGWVERLSSKLALVLLPHTLGEHVGPLESQLIWAFLFSSRLCEPLEAFLASKSGREPSVAVQGPALHPIAVLLMAMNTLHPWPKDHFPVLFSSADLQATHFSSRFPGSIVFPGTFDRNCNPLKR